MAELSDNDYATLQQVLEAFRNGQSIGQLPPLPNGADPLNILTEAYFNGASYRVGLAGLLPYAEDTLAYGIEWDTEGSSPACTRIGNLALHRSLPLQNCMKGCLLSDAGEVVEYLPPTNWTASDRSGARGQVMVEVPPFYYKAVTDGTKRRFLMSEYNLPGYRYYAGAYVGAYKASMQRSTGKLCSVVNFGTDYRGGSDQADWDELPKSLLGKPVTAKSRTQFRTAARLRGPGWEANPYALAYWAYVWLARVEYANFNCQLAFNASKDVNGFMQGGLGSGLTTITSTEWGTFNGGYSLCSCGATDALGNFSGAIPFSILNADGSTFKSLVSNRYRGIENPFGDIWEWTDGIDADIQSNADGGLSRLYVCEKPSLFTDSGAYTGYEMRGALARNEGFIKEISFGEKADLLPSVATGAGSTTYFCDHWFVVAPSSGISRRGLIFGGAAHESAAAGFGCTYSNYAPSIMTQAVGSRLCFIKS